MSDLTRFRDHCRRMAGTPVAPGCPAAAERALWIRLAAEVDAYLGRDGAMNQIHADVTPSPDDQPLTFEET